MAHIGELIGERIALVEDVVDHDMLEIQLVLRKTRIKLFGELMVTRYYLIGNALAVKTDSFKRRFAVFREIR